jgi:hypothetical protein
VPGYSFTDLIGQEFSGTTQESQQSQTFADQTVSTTTVAGIEYFISGREALPSGEPLTDAPAITTSGPNVTVSNESVFGLLPVVNDSSGNYESMSVRSYTPQIGAFSANGSVQYSQVWDISGSAKRLGDDVVQILEELFSTSSSSGANVYTDKTGFLPPTTAQSSDSPLRDALQAIIDSIKLLGESIAGFVSKILPTQSKS